MERYTITDGHGLTAAIYPEKGATLVSLALNGTEFLYQDPENLASSDRPRCGVPVLFPMFGRLKEGKYTHHGQTYAMDIHGFAHTSAWEVVQHQSGILTLRLRSDDRTRTMYPFDFTVLLSFRAFQGKLTIFLGIKNTGHEPMPYSYGFHPYFALEELSQARVETTAAQFIDFSSGSMTPVPFGHDFASVSLPEGAPETGGFFSDALGPTTLHLDALGRRLTMTHAEDFPSVVLWSPAGKPFLCVEPVHGTADGLNQGIYETLNPGEHRVIPLVFHPELL